MLVLVTGADSHVGEVVVQHLLDAGHAVSAGVRDPGCAERRLWSGRASVRLFDAAWPRWVASAVVGADAVVHLAHPAAGGPGVGALEPRQAEGLVTACRDAGVRRIVHVAGLEAHTGLQGPRSSAGIEQLLLAADVPTTVLRAGLLVGPGTPSFAALRRLAEQLPDGDLPHWLDARQQPVDVLDLAHVVAGSLRGRPRRRCFDVVGSQSTTYADLLRLVARLLGRTGPAPAGAGEPAEGMLPWVSRLDRPGQLALLADLADDVVVPETDVWRELARAGHQVVDVECSLRRALALPLAC